MADFIAPPSPSSPFYLAKGIRGDNGVQFNIFGEPLPNDLPTQFNNAGLTVPYSPINATTLFDVSSLQENREVIAAIYSPMGLYITSSVTMVWDWFRSRDNAHVFTSTFYLNPPPEGQSWNGYGTVAWIGWLSDNLAGVPTYPQYREIQENGNYSVRITVTGGHSTIQTANFVVKGIPPKTLLSNISSSGFNWLCRLSSYFDTGNYIRVGVCTSDFTEGQTSAPSGILASAYPPSSNVGCVASGSASANLSGVNYIYGYAQAANGRYYHVGSAIRVANRPNNWVWTTKQSNGRKIQGSTMPFATATEWKAFQDRINQFREYRNLNQFAFYSHHNGDNSFTTPTVGTFYAYYLRQVNNAISAMNSTGLPNLYSGDQLTASYLNTLMDKLNGIT